MLMMSSSPKCLNQSQSLKPPLRAALRSMLGSSPPAVRDRRSPSTPRHCVKQTRRCGRCPHARHREQKLKPALRAALHSMLGRSPPSRRHRRFPSTPRHCVMQNGRRARCPHARHREQKLKPALLAALHNLLGKSPPALRCRPLSSNLRHCVKQTRRSTRCPHA